jgi:hypothetical protein
MRKSNANPSIERGAETSSNHHRILDPPELGRSTYRLDEAQVG